MMPVTQLKLILECLLLSSEEPLSINRLFLLLKESLQNEEFSQGKIAQTLESLQQEYQHRSIELCEVATGFRFQVRSEYTPWLQKLLPEKQIRYSQATLETLALIAYRQPITRGEIEHIRGVSVSGQTIKTLLEREWIRVLSYKQVPGKPALYGTTSKFLHDFNLANLHELPKLAEMDIHDLTLEQEELNFQSEDA